MVMEASGFGAAGVVLFMVMHWLCDFGWNWVPSALSCRGGAFFGDWFQKGVCAASDVVLALPPSSTMAMRRFFRNLTFC